MSRRCPASSSRPPLVVVAAVALAVLVSPLSAAAEGRCAHGKWWKSETCGAFLGLTAAQSDELEQIHQTMAPQLRDAKLELDRQEARFSALLKRDDSTEGEVVTAIDDLEAARGALSKLRTLHLYRMRQVLTPDQRAAIESDFQQSRSGAPGAASSDARRGSR